MVWTIGPAGSLWGQLGSACFLAAGLFGDLLLVRLFLALGYLFLAVVAATGFPIWPNFISEKEPVVLGLDSLLWSLAGLYVHLSSLIKLVLDERPVKFNDEEEEMLWRMFYRCSGIAKGTFQNGLLHRGSFRTFYRGDVLPSSEFIFILLRGHVQGKVLLDGARGPSQNEENILHFYSGDVFEFRLLNMFGHYIGFLDSKIESTVVSESCRVFAIPVKNLESMSRGSSSTREAFSAVILSAVSKAAERPYHMRESMPVYQDENALSPIFFPLEQDELPPLHSPGFDALWTRPLSHVGYLLRKSFSMPYPFSTPISGIRHRPAYPPTGLRAANFVKRKIEGGYESSNSSDLDSVTLSPLLSRRDLETSLDSFSSDMPVTSTTSYVSNSPSELEIPDLQFSGVVSV